MLERCGKFTRCVFIQSWETRSQWIFTTAKKVFHRKLTCVRQRIPLLLKWALNRLTGMKIWIFQEESRVEALEFYRTSKHEGKQTLKWSRLLSPAFTAVIILCCALLCRAELSSTARIESGWWLQRNKTSCRQARAILKWQLNSSASYFFLRSIVKASTAQHKGGKSSNAATNVSQKN